MKSIFLYLFVIFYFAQALSGQEKKVWSFNDCVSYALQNNISIKRQELAARSSKKDYVQSVADILPDLNASAGYNFYDGTTFDNYSASYIDSKLERSNARVTSSMVLFSGFKRVNAIRQNKLDFKASLQDLEKAKNDIVLNLATAYLQILYNDDLVKISKKQLKLIEMQVEKMRVQVDIGDKSKGDLLEIKAQLGTDKVNLTNAQNQLLNSHLALVQLLELEGYVGFEIQTPSELRVEETDLIGAMEVYNHALEVLPEIKGGDLRAKSKLRGYYMALGSVMPRLMASWSYGTEFSTTKRIYEDRIDAAGRPIKIDKGVVPFKDQFKDQQYSYISLSVLVPIFGRLDRYRNISKAKINYLDAKYALEQNRKVVLKNVQEAYANALTALETYKARQEALRSRQEAFKYAQQMFNVGALNSVEYNLAKNNLFRAESDFIQAKYSYVFRTKILDFYNGKPIVIE